LKLEPGYIMGLIGPNGAGKTTFIHTLLGLYKPTQGSIKVFGYDLLEQEREAKAQISFALDENPFAEQLSARDNGKMYGRYYPNWDQKSFDKYCRQFEFNPKKPLKKLSKGNQMKFQLAFALSHNAKLLVLDEPTSGLDPVFRREFKEIMCDIISEGERSILFSTHLTEELDKIADYLTFIYNGKQQFSSSKEELLEQYALVRGSEKQITELGKSNIVGIRIRESMTEALVHKAQLSLSESLTLLQPSIEDIMYYTVNCN
ncbi:MAG: transporter related, partial [Herbinix sp.]|nr:transporter related [Herbinix sp.]